MSSTAQAIGALTAQIEYMNQRLDRDREDRKEVDQEASESREAVRKSLRHLEDGHADILRRVDKIEPVADMVTGWKARFAGAMLVLGLVGTIAFAGLAFFKDRIIELIWGA